jgi:perosamine synthetase
VRLRAQPPVHSPIGAAALVSGLRAGLAGRRAARAKVEQVLADSYAAPGLLLTDSGTSALHLALRLATSERPGPVALPGYCCYDVATAVDAAGVEFLLYDIDPGTLGPDWASLRRVLDQGAGVVVVAHLYGVPVDHSGVEALASAAGAIIVEDAAQAVGARLEGRPAGTWGRYAILSFGRGKGMTGGRGGALLANTPEAAKRLPEVAALIGRRSGGARDAAMLLAQWLLARPSLYGLPLSLPVLRLGETTYRQPTPPGEPSGFALGTLSRTLALGRAEAERRRANAAWLLQRIPENGPVSAPRPPGTSEAGFLRFPVLVGPPALSRFRAERARYLGVWPGYPRPLSELAGFGSRRLDAQHATPGAGALAERLFTLPTHSLVNEDTRTALTDLIVGAGVANSPQPRSGAAS